jgi:diaminohydroxyphosphoribosylaminopyrimidine deaminase/5-amino-6-(5-phosphoribosylamino)uracil reductase
MDTRQRLPVSARLARTAREIPTFLISPAPPRPDLAALGIRFVTLGTGALRPDPKEAVEALRAAGLRRLFIEGGGQVAASFLASGLVDQLIWFRAPLVLGARGRPAVGDLPWDRLAEASRFRRVTIAEFGPDLCETYERI